MGYKIQKIAQELGRHPSTIYRELKRNQDERGYYYTNKAHCYAKSRRKNNGLRARRIPESLWVKVEYLLELQWSPEQIANKTGVSHESIYRYVYKDKIQRGELYLNLRQSKKRRQKRVNRNKKGCLIPYAVSIDKRPKIVDKRTRFGDFEVDTIIGANQQQALVTIVERKSGLTFIQKVPNKTAELVSKAIVELLLPIKSKVKTITSDNGSEFTHHQYVAERLKCKYYFAHPYSSWERGTNENTNGLIIQYFPKKMPFAMISHEDVLAVMARLNHRPRKRLGFETPNQVFYKLDWHLAFEPTVYFFDK